MYGVKGTSTILNTVARQGVLTKQFTAPKSTAFLARQVSAGKLSYTTTRPTQFSQKSIQQQQQDQTDLNTTTSASTLSHFPQQQSTWKTVGSSGLNKNQNKYKAIEPIEPDQIDLRILEAAQRNDSIAVVKAFKQGKSALGNTPPSLSTQTYEAVITAYGKLHKANQPITPLLNAYQDMVATGTPPSSKTYATLIRSLCSRAHEVQMTTNMLHRKIARTGATVDNLGDLESEKNMEQALAIFIQAVKDQRTQAFDTDLYNRLLHGLASRGNTEDALYIYEHLESARNAQPNSLTFVNLMSLFGNAGDLKAVQECFLEYKSMRDTLPQHNPVKIYNALVFAHANAGDIKGALDVVENVMVKDQVPVTIVPYNKILRRACHDNQMETAESIIAKLESDVSLPKPDENTYATILSALSRQLDFDKAPKVYQNLLKHDLSKQYGHLADYAYACSNHHRPDEALKVIQDMSKHGFDLNDNLGEAVVNSYLKENRVEDAVAALNTVISLYAKHHIVNNQSSIAKMAVDMVPQCKDFGSALSILQCMSVYAIHPTPLASRTLLKLYKEVKSDPDQWKQVSTGLSTQSYRILYDAVFRNENYPTDFCTMAFELLEDMNRLNLAPDNGLYVRVMSRMKKYRATEAVERWKKVMAPYISTIQDQIELENKFINSKQVEPLATTDSDLLSSVAVDACLRGEFDSAINVLKNQIVKDGKCPTPEAVRDMIQLSTKAGRLDYAQNIYECVREPYNRLIGGRRLRAISIIYNSMLIAHARKGDLNSAKEFYDTLRKNGLYPDGDAYGSLLSCSSNETTDESTDALAIYKEVKKHNVRPTVYLYNVILSKLAKCRKVDPVLQLFEEMKTFGITPNSITYASVISACIRCSSESRAEHYFDEMIHAPRFQPRIGVFNSMIQYYVQQNPDREKALEYYNLLKKFNLKPSQHTYRLLMEAYANIPAYDMLSAHKLLTDMKKHDGLQPTPDHYATLIRSYGCLHRDVQSALAVYNDMKKTGVQPNEIVYQAMLNTYIDNNDMSHAEELYKEMADQGTKTSAYIENLFITGYGNQKELEKAENVFKKMSEYKKEPSTYEAMAKAYVENGQTELANNVVEQMRARDFPPKVVQGVIQLINQATK
ncbi:hypothetical protein BD770DRAFT_402526 [Pilaira anomala]|nr:hypothetical protein BD770DRAFT_402526 [Pilaira anomala]